MLIYILIFAGGFLFGGLIFLGAFIKVKKRGILIFNLDDSDDQNVVLRFSKEYEKIINQHYIVLKVALNPMAEKKSAPIIDKNLKKEDF